MNALYLDRYYPELRKPADAQLLQRYKTGHDVGLLARQLFPNGIEVYKRDSDDLVGAIQMTKQLISNFAGPIYEGAFLYNNLLCISDIIVPGKEGWDIYEIKSSTSITETNIDDVAFQYHLLNLLELPIHDIFLTYLNVEYVRHEELNINELFISVSLYDEVLKKQDEVKSCVKEFSEILQGDIAPDIKIGIQCLTPYPCDFKDHCWKHIPTGSVFDITRLKKTDKFALYNKGVVKLEDIPSSFPLNNKQKIQVESQVKRKVHLDKEKIREFLQSLKYPLFCMDFESIMPAVPLFANTRPYQQIVFQYSIHLLKNIHDEPEHFEFLAHQGGDPRPEFIEQLLNVLHGDSDIIVYNAPFEISRLRELAWDFVNYADDIENIISRIKDLLLPFRERYIYHPQMCGSNSLKAVVPALIPKLSYSDLEISNGGTAMNSFEQLQFEYDNDVISRIRTALLKYCERDTLSLVRLIQKLDELSNG